MKRLLKVALWVLVVIGVVIGVAVTVLVTIINPNDFKEEITKTLEHRTGLVVNIDGNIHWRFFPALGIQASGIHLQSPAGFSVQNLATLGNLTMELQLSSLLFGQISISTLELSNGQLYLERTVSGENNWELARPTNASKPAADGTPYALIGSTNSATKRAPIVLSISKFRLEDFSVDYQDHQTQKHYAIKNASFRGDAVQFKRPFKLQGDLDFLIDQHEGNAQFLGNAQVTADLNYFALDDFELRLKSNDITKPFEQTRLRFNLEANQAEHQVSVSRLDGILLGAPIQGDLSILYSDTKPVQVSGALEAEALPIGALKMESAMISIHSKDNQIFLSPIQARLYEGTLNAQMTLTHSPGEALSWQAEGDIQQLNASALSQALLKAPLLSGQGQSNFVLSGAIAQTTQAQLDSVTGEINLELSDGALHGLDISALLDDPKAGLKPEGAQTLFETITADLNIENGTIENNNFSLKAETYQAKGRGKLALTANALPQSHLTYRLEAYANKLKDIPIAILIKGPLHRPDIVPDVEAYVKALLKKEGKKRLLDVLGLDAKLPAESKPTTDSTETEGTDEPPTPLDAIEDLFNAPFFGR